MAYVETVDFETTIANLHVRVEAGIYGVGTDEEWADLEVVYLQDFLWDEDTGEPIRKGEIEMDVSNIMVWQGKDKADVSAWDELEAEALEMYHNGQW